jgi:hypothetical protein
MGGIKGQAGDPGRKSLCRQSNLSREAAVSQAQDPFVSFHRSLSQGVPDVRHSTAQGIAKYLLTFLAIAQPSEVLAPIQLREEGR